LEVIVPDLPSGTVTFLFTDIEGSTRLLQRLGEDYGGVLGEHRRLLRRTWSAYSGDEIDAHGDAFLVVFRRAQDAAQAAVAAQRALADESWPEGSDLRVRMGIHTASRRCQTRDISAWESTAQPGSARPRTAAKS
jgi:class 3 adenylate cyclase